MHSFLNKWLAQFTKEVASGQGGRDVVRNPPIAVESLFLFLIYFRDGTYVAWYQDICLTGYFPRDSPEPDITPGHPFPLGYPPPPPPLGYFPLVWLPLLGAIILTSGFFSMC